MPVASSGRGPFVAAGALASQVKPMFTGPAVASSVYGGLLAGVEAPLPATVHLLATGLAVYTAHVKDSYVDFYGRGEDPSLPLSRRGCALALAGAGVGFAACLAALWWLVGPAAALLVLPLWLLAFLHAPWLDRHPVGTSTDYATGVALVVLSAFYVQAGRLTPTAVGVAAVFVPVLAAGAILSDVGDLPADRRLGKRTVPAVVGADGARWLAAGLVGLAALLVVALVVAGVLPGAALVGAVALGLAGAGSRALAARRGLLLLMVGMAAAATLLLLALRGLPPW